MLNVNQRKRFQTLQTQSELGARTTNKQAELDEYIKAIESDEAAMSCPGF